MSKQVVMTSVAPGDWRYAANPDRTVRVDVTFPGASDVVALRAQVTTWLDAMVRCVDLDATIGARAALLVPSRSDDGAVDSPVLHYLAPLKIGAAILPAKKGPADVLKVLRRIAVALDALHARGFIHGALGMSSLWWMEDGTLRFPDAGLTHMLDGVLRPPKLAGAYLAPEIWRRGGTMPASDQYGLAVIAFELFTGRGRFIEDEDNGVQSVQPLTLESNARLYDGAPAELNDVMQRALSTSPSSRFGSCVEFVDALEGHTTAAKSLPTVHRFATFKGGFNKQTAILALATVAVLGGSAYVMRAGVKQRAIGGIDLNFGDVAYAAREKAGALPSIDVRSAGTSSAPSGGSGSSAPGTETGSAAPKGAGGASSSSGSDATVSSSSGVSKSPTPTPAATSLQSRAATVARDVKRAVAGSEAASTPAYSTGSAPGGSRSSGSEPVAAGGRGATGGGSAPATYSTGGAATARSAPGTNPGGTTAGTAGTSARAVASGGTSGGGATSGAARDTVAARTASPAKAPSGSALSEWVGKVVGSSPATPTAPLATGTVQLKGPSRARYYVDGVLVRPVRGKVTANEGEHDVDIVIPNGSIYRRRVTVLAGQTIVVKP
ncbi:MAG: protein kinase [Gemmatimonadota bacterium]